MKNYTGLRQEMVEEQIAAKGIHDSAVLRAMREIPRERFVPPEMKDLAYSDMPLPIGEGQKISQPYAVAMMAEAMEISRGDRAHRGTAPTAFPGSCSQKTRGAPT